MGLAEDNFDPAILAPTTMIQHLAPLSQFPN